MSLNLIDHLARLNDCVFALVMAITFMGFNLPETIKSMPNIEINHFLLEQLKSLGIYITTFILVAFYWISHIQQFSYYKKTNEIHLIIHTLYLMCLFVIPFSNELILTISNNVFVKVWFSVNICLIGFLSFISWVYATNKHRLVDENLDRQIILLVKAKALIEPCCALISIPIAIISPDFSDLVWFLIPVTSAIVDKAFKVNSGAM
ncbi:TMEM175 family protein [Nostoc sp. 106C]|uniref:TMEM175 family protein n=1 Tax=Nostoc sp. 106C TaxID=1932667 RepID=UPI000A39C7DE|nr:TMEM175 family protein [Nostoc sp. 106C]OUL31068.1 hypothetical protein BV375_12655 [Nostoc sp. 106C]